MRVTVVGAGYVGLVVAAGLGSVGHRVTLLDRDAVRVDAVERRQLPFYEPGLAELLDRAEQLVPTGDVDLAMQDAEVVIIAVGTPPRSDGRPCLRALDEVVESLRSLDPQTVVVVKSTVPVGTGDAVQERLRAEVVSNPEFLREGAAVQDFLNPHRVVLGVASPRAVEVMTRLYGPLLGGSERLRVCDRRSAELSKVAANAMLATRVSFVNELAQLCEATGADIDAVRGVLGSDPRIGARYLRPSLGWGGSCLPKDVDALLATASDVGVSMRVVSAAREANLGQRRVLLGRLRDGLDGLRGRKVAVWGLAFKADTDDVRESVAVELVGELLRSGAQVAAHDPRALERARLVVGEEPQWCSSPWQALEGADALVLCTEWHEYRSPDWQRVRGLLRGDLVVDGRNLWAPDAVGGVGLRYWGLGRSTRRSPSPHTV